MSAEIRRVVQSLDPNVTLGDPELMTVLVRNSIYTDRMVAILSVGGT